MTIHLAAAAALFALPAVVSATPTSNVPNAVSPPARVVPDRNSGAGSVQPDAIHQPLTARLLAPGQAAGVPAEEAGHATTSDGSLLRGDGGPLLRLAQAQTSVSSDVTVGSLRIANGWSRATARAGATGAGFVTIRNTSGEPDRLVSASSPVAATVELHTHIEENGVMRMRPVEGIEIPAHGEVILAPGGLHIMLIDTNAPLRQGSSVPVTLRFEHAGEVTITLAVQGAGATKPGGGHHGH